MSLSGKVALVTGAGRGIGREIAVALVREGASVVVTARTASELDALAASVGRERCHPIPADLTRPEDVSRVFDELDRRHGRLDILVNNAGIGKFGPVRRLEVADFDAMWNLNMRAVFLCTKNALPIMERQSDGMIVNIASLAGKNSLKDGAAYAATKWALLGFGKSLMLEERSFNIRVVTICPGSVETSFSPKESHPGSRQNILLPQDVAEAVLSAVRMPARAMISEIELRPTNPA